MRGRPLAAALAADHPDRTWEASHIGGCRFAAAMVLLPHGIVLGDVPVGEGADVAALYAAGLVPSRGVRGRASLPPAVQAAQHHARLATGAYGVDALVPTDVRPDGPGSWRVGFSEPDVTVVLTEQRVDTGRALTCAATTPGWMRVFDLVDVARGDSGCRAEPDARRSVLRGEPVDQQGQACARASTRPWRSADPAGWSAGPKRPRRMPGVRR